MVCTGKDNHGDTPTSYCNIIFKSIGLCYEHSLVYHREIAMKAVDYVSI